MYNLLNDVQSTILMGAGPSSVAPSTYHAMSRNTLGHMDPYFLKIMDELMAGLRVLFGTDNLLTIPLSGTGSLGMEAAFVNLVEAGDKVLILQNGVFGVRMVEVATRLGAEVTEIAFPWGMPVDLDDVEKAIRQDGHPVSILYRRGPTPFLRRRWRPPTGFHPVPRWSIFAAKAPAR